MSNCFNSLSAAILAVFLYFFFFFLLGDVLSILISKVLNNQTENLSPPAPVLDSLHLVHVFVHLSKFVLMNGFQLHHLQVFFHFSCLVSSRRCMAVASYLAVEEGELPVCSKIRT